MKKESPLKIRQIDKFHWLIPKQGKMRTEGLLFLDKKLLEFARFDKSFQQVANVACLPGIVGRSLAMPDMHQGYGFTIGGVAAFDLSSGIVSPGGVGYDINCGVRMLKSNLNRQEIQSKIEDLINGLFQAIPTGVGSAHKKGRFRVDKKKLRKVLSSGAEWAVKQGFGRSGDLSHIEDEGCLHWTDPDLVSEAALNRGKDQLGTLGSGNHFVEIDYVEKIYDEKTARLMGFYPDQIIVAIHTGSRGLGHQVCSDFIKKLQAAGHKYGIEFPDRELCCAPIDSIEGQNYLAAMAAAANFAFANRQMITQLVRTTFERVLGKGEQSLGMDLLYDVCHNIAKYEEHTVRGKKQKILVHRKGATRSFPPGHMQVPEAFKITGQPVLTPGDMGRYSYVLAGTEKAMQETFGSTCHGAGRLLSRHAAMKVTKKQGLAEIINQLNVKVLGAGKRTIAEEIPDAYKDVNDVVRVVHQTGIARRVVRLKPLGVIKG